MAIFRCKKCGHIREVGKEYIGRSVKCPKCENITVINDTIPFINALIKKYIEQQKELYEIRNESKESNVNQDISENINLNEIDIYNTDILTLPNNLEPIEKWFKERKIQITAHPESTDTTGFFDEIALSIGENYNVLNFVINQIKYIQNKGYSNVKLELTKKNSQEKRKIKSFCKELYDYSFVAKQFYSKKDDTIWLTPQTAPKIRDFFNGIWMEWYSFMEILDLFRAQEIKFVCTRNLDISFSNGNQNELDLFFLTEKDVPICIECKSGEFRQDIDKYLNLRKQLNIDKNQFILCVFGLSQEQAQGMTSMYEITFVNELSLIQHIQTLVN